MDSHGGGGDFGGGDFGGHSHHDASSFSHSHHSPSDSGHHHCHDSHHHGSHGHTHQGNAGHGGDAVASENLVGDATMLFMHDTSARRRTVGAMSSHDTANEIKIMLTLFAVFGFIALAFLVAVLATQ